MVMLLQLMSLAADDGVQREPSNLGHAFADFVLSVQWRECAQHKGLYVPVEGRWQRGR